MINQVTNKKRFIFKLLIVALNFIFFLTTIKAQSLLKSNHVSFTKHILANNFDRVSGLFVCDIDNDNNKDILGTAINANEVAWWRNDGGNPVTWTKLTIDSNYRGAIYVYAADINGDSLMDVLATAAIGNKVSWWKNNGGSHISWAKYTVASNFSSAHGIFAADLDNDNDNDILATSASLNRINWWENKSGDGSSWVEHPIDNNFKGTQSVAAKDIDGDGDFDVIGAAATDNEIAWWRNDGGAPIQWSKQTISKNFNVAHWVYSYDVDGDNDNDVMGAAAGANDIAWWRNDGKDPIVWVKQTLDYNFMGALTVHADDLDNDGDIDVIGTAGWAGHIAWWANDGNNPINWTKHIIENNFSDAWPIYTSDLDGDGDKDIVAGSSSLNQIRWWENNLTTSVAPQKRNLFPGFQLHQNYPNPFNLHTTISFTLSQPANLKLNIYDIKGRLVKSLFNTEMWQAGFYSINWNGMDDAGKTVSSGVYIVKMECVDFYEVNKILLVK